VEVRVPSWEDSTRTESRLCQGSTVHVILRTAAPATGIDCLRKIHAAALLPGTWMAAASVYVCLRCTWRLQWRGSGDGMRNAM
jgi:hypothetical protein